MGMMAATPGSILVDRTKNITSRHRLTGRTDRLYAAGRARIRTAAVETRVVKSECSSGGPIPPLKTWLNSLRVGWKTIWGGEGEAGASLFNEGRTEGAGLTP